MAIRGQRFTLDPKADNFTFNIQENEPDIDENEGLDLVKEIREREPSSAPPPPKPKANKTGFPQHRTRNNPSAFKLKQQQQSASSVNKEPSDRAILHHATRKFGFDPETKEKQEIGAENERRIAQMSAEDIEEARAEVMANMSPEFLEKFLKRANIEEDQNEQDWDRHDLKDMSTESKTSISKESQKKVSFSSTLPSEEVVDDSEHHGLDSLQQTREPGSSDAQFKEVTPSMHFPVPPRNPDDYVPLDPEAPTFLSDLKKHYFPDLPEDPSSLGWLQDPTEEESKSSPYAPTQTRYAPSDIRFDFNGRLLAPNDSREIPVSKGLHHHGQAPESAGYTIPELSILARSVLPNQRCVAYQVLGRILYRLGRGDFGPRGSELQESLWGCIERERPLEIIMSEANRTGGHMSAKSYATEALWLWRKGGGGDRGVLKPTERIAK